MATMSLVDSYAVLARYNTWMNRRLYALCAERLTDERRKEDRGAFFRSIHGTLNHILLADRAWLGRFVGDRERYASRDASGEIIQVKSLDQELYSSFDELRAQRLQTDADIESWAAGLDEQRLTAPLTYRTSSGEHYSHPLWWAVSHFFNHQTHHRGQVTNMLNQLGVDPGVTDLAVMLREEAART